MMCVWFACVICFSVYVFMVYGVCVLCVHACVHVYACKVVSGVRFVCAFALVGLIALLCADVLCVC